MNEPMPELKGNAQSVAPSAVAGAVKLHDLSIKILGTGVSITTNEDPAFLEKVLVQYQAAIADTQDISGMKDPLRIAILTGFLLCAEINKLKLQIENEQINVEEELDRIARNMIACIDRVMEKTNPLNERVLQAP